MNNDERYCCGEEGLIVLEYSLIHTTDIYAKIEDKTIEREMRKME